MQTVIDGPDVLNSYRAASVPGDDTWQILDPLGGAICCASTRARADEVVRYLTVSANQRDADDASAC